MATPKKTEPLTMDASIGDLGIHISTLKSDVVNLIQTGTGITSVIADVQVLALDLGELVASLEGHPLMTSCSEGCKEKCETVHAECQSILDTIRIERPRFAAASAGESLTEGSKIDNLLAFIEKFLPLLMLFFK